jgi:hypothetical protein
MYTRHDEKDSQYNPNNPMNPAVPRNTSSLLIPCCPSGKSGTRLNHMYSDPRIVVHSMRTKMICSAWNCGPSLFPVRILAAVFIYVR